ncbi:MAG: T9SS type A sorting domain-containing protein [Chitinophagaceae bacterium]|nr:T9SS type A sorting domain-containing protein [Chitinophagaceae bacterium]
MQPKFTLNYLLSLLLILFTSKLNSQTFVNGNLSTGATSSNGVPAPTGFTWSEVQNPNANAGYSCNITGFTLADNFTVPSGQIWNISKIVFFAYSTGYTGTTSPYNDVRVRIYNGAPNGGGTVIFGDMTTNRFLASSSAAMYRIFNATPGTTRHIWAIEANVNTTLSSGNYWIEWGVNNTTPLTSNFTPPSTIVGVPSPPGANALQFNVSTNTWTAVTDAGGPQDFHFIIHYTLGGGPCTGTPNPGNTIATPASVCPGTNFTLSLQNTTPGTGVTYQWQSGPSSSGPWTNISGATNPTYTGTQTSATWYRCQVSCGSNTGISNPVQVAMEPITNCYCTTTYTSGCALGDYIANVTLLTLNNTTTCSNPPYTYYNNIPAPTLIVGGTFPLSIRVGPDTFGQFAAAWIDFNQDGDFNDPGECLGTTPNLGANGTGVLNFTVPTNAVLGTTRLRVRGGNDVALTCAQSCGVSSSNFGETEDYNVNIAPCVPITNVTGPVNTTVQCSQNTQLSVNLGSASIPTVGWEYRTSPTAVWQNVTNGPGPGGVQFSGATTPTLTLSGVPASLNGYQFRAFFSNPCSAIDFSQTATLTVVPLVATVNPTSATICRGTVLPLSLTNTTANTVLFSESFNTVSPLPAGWASQNRSQPLGTTDWFQGVPSIFPSQSGAPNAYIAANWQNTDPNGVGTISNWLFTPTVTIKNGDFLTFWTRTVSPAQYPDRLEVRMSTNGSSTNVGTTATSVGDFTTLLLTINPNLTTTGYPTSWTQYTVTVSGLSGPVTGRFAFRYFVTNGGGLGANSDYIGIDEVSFTSLGAFGQGVWSGPAGTMWSDPAATVPYTGTPATTIYVNPTSNATYSVVYTTSAPLPTCVSNPTTIPVTVIQPLGGQVHPQNRAVCVGGTTTFSISPTGGPFQYQWQESRDNGLTWNNLTNTGVYSGVNTSTLTLTGVTRSAPVDMNNFLYRCVVNTAPCPGSYTTNAASLTVHPLPNVTITANDLALLPNQTATITGSSSPAPNTTTPNWVWTRNGVVIPGANTNSVSANIDQLGVYQATVTDINGCRNTSNELTIDAEVSDKLWIYPNPTTGQFQIRLYYPKTTSEKRRIQVFNASGEEVMSRDIMLSLITSPHYQRFDIDLSFHPAGTYLVRVIDLYSGKAAQGFIVKQAR